MAARMDSIGGEPRVRPSEIAVDPAAESDRQIWLGHHVHAVDPDRGRTRELQEFGVFLATDEDQLNGRLDDPLAQDSLEVSMRLFEVRAVLEGKQFDEQIGHPRSLHRPPERGLP